MMTDASARAVIVEAYRATHGKDPSLAEAQFFGAVGLLESGYGSKPEGSHNWGGVHAPCKPPDGAKKGDVYTCKDGSSAIVVQESKDGNVATTGYLWGMRVYPSDVEGSAHVIRLLTKGKSYAKVWEAMKAGDGHGAVYAMKASGYYGVSAEKYEKAVESCVRQIARNVDGGDVALSFSTGAKPPSPPLTTGEKVGGGAVIALLAALGLLAIARKGRR